MSDGVIEIVQDGGVVEVLGGSPGLSAYQLAVANGFVGSVAAWLASMHGPTGETGNAGPLGPAGTPGPTGEMSLAATNTAIDTRPFLSGAPGAIARPFLMRMKDLPWTVKDFDPTASGDGIHDNSTVFGKIGASGELVEVRGGTWALEHAAFTGGAGGLRGSGTEITTIKFMCSAGTEALTVAGSSPDFIPKVGNYSHRFSDLSFDGRSSTQRGWTAFGIDNIAGMVFRDILFRGIPKFARLTNCFWTFIDGCNAFDLDYGTGVGFEQDGGWLHADRLFYESSTPGGYSQEAEAFFKVLASYGTFLGDTGVISHIRRALYVYVTTGKFAEISQAGRINFDQCSVAGIELFANGGTIRNWGFDGTFIGSCSTNIYAHLASGGAIHSVDLDAVRALNALNTNVYLADVEAVSINGGDFGSAGYVLSGTCNTSSANNAVTVTSGFGFTTVMAGHNMIINGIAYLIAAIVTGSTAYLATNPGTQTGVACSFVSDTQTNIVLAGSTKKASICGTRARKVPGLSSQPAAGIVIGAAVDEISIEGNDLTDVATPILSQKTTPFTRAVIKGNRGVDTEIATLASAATLALGFVDTYQITGNVTVTAITGPAWPGRRVILMNMSGPLSFTSGSSIGQSVTLPNNPGPHTAIFINGQWWIAS